MKTNDAPPPERVGHTKGPWTYSERWDEIHGAGERFAIFKPMANMAHEATIKADCALICLAPDLLAFVEKVESGMVSDDEMHHHLLPPDLVDAARALLSRLGVPHAE